MYIDKFKKDNHYYDEYNRIYYNAIDFIATGIFDFCGCGMPKQVLEHIRKSMQLLDDLKKLVWTNKITYEQWKERKAEVFKDEGSEYFMWYFLDNNELTEHGGSVPGWLTEDGIELLSDLTELSASNYKVA